ncbi:MAG TPA: quinoprotein relay system zinc metallohydrolase 2 [Sphingomonas sp.]|nr:quinoprotein relay system zinc metallohydrolase 2 [Sphingomonas sp.]
MRSCSSDLTRRAAILAAGASCSVAAFASGDGLVEVAPGLFVRRGVDAEASRANLDGIANAGFAIGAASICVTDPGGSMADGAALRRAIRRRSALPISHVILNHDHPDHLFGASAFVADRPAFVGHRALAGSLAARGDYYRARLAEAIGADAAGSLVAPTLPVTDVSRIDLGGRMLEVTAHPPAHTHCDLSTRDMTSGVLLTGDLLFVGRVPAWDGSLTGWLAVLEAMRGARAVPGHGPAIVALPSAVAGLRRYLLALRDGTRRAIAANVPIAVAAKTVAIEERPHWRLFDAYHPRNVIQAYKELEWE